MRYRVVAVGRVRDAALRAACDDYLERLRRYTKVGQLADWTARWEMDGRDVTFAIGGAAALPPPLLRQAERVWSLSRLTFPHELARVVLYEQLYRAYTIRRGEPYHRGP